MRAEAHLRELLARRNLPQPDDIEYGETCIRLFWTEQELCLVVDLDDMPPHDPAAA